MRRIEAVLGPLAVRLEHVGSTAVPGLAAKPILDLQLSVAALEPLDAYAGPLASLGYVFVPDRRCPTTASSAYRPSGRGHTTSTSARREANRAPASGRPRLPARASGRGGELRGAQARGGGATPAGPARLHGRQGPARQQARGASAPMGAAPWTVDKRVHAGRENLDPAHVARYDRKEDANAAPSWPRCGRAASTTARPSSTSARAPASSRWRGGSGSQGGRGGRLPAMLEQLAPSSGERGIDNVELVAAGFLTYEHAGSRADLVYSRYALHHLPDFWKAVALTRIAAMLRPDGVLRLVDVVYGFDPAEAGTVLERWMLDRGVGRPRGRLDPRRARRARPRREQHVHVAARADAREGRSGHRARRVQRGPDVRRLHLRPPRPPAKAQSMTDSTTPQSCRTSTAAG